MRLYNDGKPRAYKTTVAERFEAKFIPEPNSGCWLWLGALCNDAGYGAFRMGGRRVTSNRASWMIYRGTIPEGMEIDHRCRNPYCVNPEHLRPLTPAANLAARQLDQETCRRGHAMTGDNLLIETIYVRRCKCCRSVSRIRYHSKLRERLEA